MTTAGLIARKIGMTRMVDAEGQMTPVTLLQVESQRVTKILTPERDGYHGVQIGYYQKTEKHLNKSDVSRLRKVNVPESFCRFKEFRFEAAPGLELGSQLEISALDGVPSLDVTGVCKGHGFAGAHVRWNSAVGRMTHGSRFHRSPGSLGMRATPGKVMKGRHQPGQHGNTQKTIQNLKVMDLDQESGVLAIKGSVPGAADGYIVLRPSLKIKKKKVAAK